VELSKNIDGFYTQTPQKGGFSKLCVKIKKRCYADLATFDIQQNSILYALMLKERSKQK
jgi:hypothetical protein